MASMLSSCIRSAGVRRVRGLYALPDRQIYACSCQHTPGHTSTYSSKGEQPTRRYVHHAKVFSTIPRPLAARGLWPYSHVYYRPEYHITCLRDPTSYNSFVIKHSLHTTAWLFKEDTVVEKSVKALKDEIEEQKSDGTSVSKSKDKKVTEEKPPEGFFAIRKAKFNATLAEMRKTGYLRYFWNAFKGFVLHYKDGFVLFWKNLKYCMPLLLKYLRQGRSSLKRREYNLLTKTLADLFRMVPLIPMVIIPLGEIFIPFYVKLGMMPSVFRNKTNTKEFKRQLQTKVEYAHLLTSSLQDIPLKKDGSGSSIHDFTDFMQKMKSTETIPTIDEITKFSTLFEDTITLDDLNIVQLQALGKLLGIGFLGKIPSAPVLRFQIMMKVRELEVDDKLIQKEGIESMTTEELQAANRARGMRGIGVSEDRLKMQILQWLELHLKRRVPTSLLLLSRVMYLDENLSPAEQLKQTISALPETTVDKVIVSSAESKGEAVDRKTKIKVLEEEHKAIVMEKKQEEEEKRQTEMAEKQTLEKKEEQRKLKAEEDAQALHTLHTVEKKHIDQELAKLLEERAAEIDPLTPDISQAELTKEAHVILEKEILHDVKVTQDIAKPIQDEEPAEGEADITAKDLGDIEKAIEDMAVHHKDELSEVKEDLDEYLEDMEDIKAICEDKAFTKRVNETKGAQTLRSHLNKYLNKLDSTISNIQDTKMQLQAKLEQQEVQLKYDLDGNRDELLGDIETKKGRLISINDVLLSLKRLQKTPDDVRMQQILQVLDTDEDGLIDINDVLKVTELLSRENLKLNKSQIGAMMTLLRKEEELQQEERRKEKEEKQKESEPTAKEEPPRNVS